MSRVAVLHNTLDLQGGADAVCLQTCRALAQAHDVTLFTISRIDPERLAARMDLPLDVTVRQPPGAAIAAGALERLGPYLGPQLAARSVMLRAFVRRRLVGFDAAVSTANELSLPIPSLQYVHFPQFRLEDTPAGKAGRLNALWSRLAAPDRDTGVPPTLIANSAWTADVVEALYDDRPQVCHPPVDPIAGQPWSERTAGVLVLGRIAPDKRPLAALDVIERLRERGHDLEARIVGSASPAYRGYVDRVKRRASGLDAVSVETDVSRGRLETLLGRYRYGLNMKPDEHFGMAVAEYVAAGMLPFVPRGGGQVDVVDGEPGLLFEGVSSAADRIETALQEGREPALARDRFGSDRFDREIRARVAKIIG